MRTICILAAIISTLFTSLFAQDVVINGYASLAKNSKVYAFEVIDEITNQRSLLTQTVGNDEGNFSLKIPVKKTKSIIATGKPIELKETSTDAWVKLFFNRKGSIL